MWVLLLPLGIISPKKHGSLTSPCIKHLAEKIPQILTGNNLNPSEREERRWHHHWSTTPRFSEGIKHFWTSSARILIFTWEIISGVLMQLPWAGWSLCDHTGSSAKALGPCRAVSRLGPAHAMPQQQGSVPAAQAVLPGAGLCVSTASRPWVCFEPPTTRVMEKPEETLWGRQEPDLSRKMEQRPNLNQPVVLCSISLVLLGASDAHQTIFRSFSKNVLFQFILQESIRWCTTLGRRWRILSVF